MRTNEMKKSVRNTALKTMTSLGFLLGLASCTAVTTDPYLTTQAVSPDVAPSVTDVSADFAAAYLPGFAGAIQSVRQTVANNSLHQEIVYANQTSLSGENVLTVDIGPPQDADFLRPPSEWRIKTDMRQALPGIAMTISPIIADNASGTYGYATAAVGQGACLYAWQYVKQVTPADSSGFTKLTRRHLAAAIRLRYCHPAIAADRIHVLMDGLKLKDMNSQTIDMLRFAAGTAHVDQPPAVVTAEPVTLRQKVVRHVATNDEDWRQPQKTSAKMTANPSFIDNAVSVPLPEADKVQPVTVPADDAMSQDQTKIDRATTVPIPQ
jgi:hypothetical protein